MNTNDTTNEHHPDTFACPACGLHFKDPETMKECEAWCVENKSCNLEIIKHSVEESQK